jgi:serine/threonine-protein kinase
MADDGNARRGEPKRRTEPPADPTHADKPVRPEQKPVAGRRPDVLVVGEVVDGNYEIVRVIGAGGMGQVYEARDRALGRQVALKVSWPDVGSDPLLQEARAMAAFRHAGLVTVHFVGRFHGMDYLVMELLQGVTLASHLARRRGEAPFAVDEALEILGSICDTLSVLHAAGLAHRDLKPENIMLAPRGRVVLLDLGIVRLERFISEEKTIAGSPLYLAPESIRAQVKTGEAHLVDIYALGVIAFELLAGRTPFLADGQPLELLQRHLRAIPPRASSLRQVLPPSLDRLIAEMLSKRPEDRPPTIDVVAATLRSVRGSLERVSASPLSVLVVDDDDDARRLLEYFVRRSASSVEVRSAADGAEALRMFHERAPDLMLLDLDLPTMSGVEVCMYLRGTKIANRTTICVVATVDDDNKAVLEQLGVADVITRKDAGPTALATEIRSLVKRIEDGRGKSDPRRTEKNARGSR